jgi:hypothetical protein
MLFDLIQGKILSEIRNLIPLKTLSEIAIRKDQNLSLV